jgi:putative colanic acid biosynthesis acetyltransferase WcaF
MSEVDLSSYENQWYRPGNRLKLIIWYFTNLLIFNHGFFPLSSLKVQLLRLFGSKIGAGVVIKPSVNIKYPWYLTIGDHVWIGEEVWIDNLAPVSIGSNSCISQGAMLLTGNHNYRKPTFDLMIGEIHLEDGVWIGAKSIVCPGVTCQSHAVLGVASVATKSLESYTIYQGNPAKPIRARIIDP